MSITASYILTQAPVMRMVYNEVQSKVKKVMTFDTSTEATMKMIKKAAAIVIAITLVATLLILANGERQKEDLVKKQNTHKANEILKDHIVAVISINTIVFSIMSLGAFHLKAPLGQIITILTLELGILLGLGYHYSELEKALKSKGNAEAPKADEAIEPKPTK